MNKAILILSSCAVLFFFLGIYFFGPDPNIIDENYISSKEYQSLQAQIDDNRRTTIQKEELLNLVAIKILSGGTSPDRRLPYILDSLSIDSLGVPDNKIRLDFSGVKPDEFKNFSFYRALAMSKENTDLVFFLMQHPGIYKEIDIVLATVKDSSVVDMKSVGSFRKNLAEEITSTILINRDHIETKVEKLRFYPVEQHNVIHYRYTVANDGFIYVDRESEKE